MQNGVYLVAGLVFAALVPRSMGPDTIVRPNRMEGAQAVAATPEPLVSVVIPTRNRPRQVANAVRSALAQTVTQIEVVVAIDGPDDPTYQTTLDALEEIGDPRLRVVTLQVHMGHAEATNVGVATARSPWVALLDDDDEWFPRKIEAQLRAARQSPHPYPIIACRVLARGDAGDVVWPRRTPGRDESFSDYLFCRSSPFGGEGLVLPSAILTRKELLQRVPMDPRHKRHMDVGWLLRVIRLAGVAVEFIPEIEPQLVWDVREGRERLSNSADWRYSLSWMRENRELVTPRSYAAFVMTWAASTAARGGHWAAFPRLLIDGYRYGRPTTMELWTFVAIWLIPRRVQREAAILFARWHSRGRQRRGDR